MFFGSLDCAQFAIRQLLPQLKGPLPSIIALQNPPSEVETLLLRSIEWTTFMEATYDTALEQATVILRYFLGMPSVLTLMCRSFVQGSGRVALARGLLDMLPRELASIDEPEERATEYLHYRQFFNVWGLLDRVVECQSLEASLMNKDTRIAWLKDYKVNNESHAFVQLISFLNQGLVDQAYESIVKLLTSDWMLPDQNNPIGLYRL